MSEIIYTSYRDTDCISNRSLLYNASEEDTSNYIEKMYLTQYKQTVDQIEFKQTKLSEIREKIREFPSTEENSIEHKNLQAFASRIANTINELEHDLSNLEQTALLQRVLIRENQKLMERERELGEKAIEKYYEDKTKEVEEFVKRYEESRAEVLKNRKQAIEKPVQQEAKPKKSRIKKLFSKIIDFFTNEGNLDALLGIFYIFWFGFVGRIIIISDIHIVFKIIMIAGDLFLALYMFVQQHNSTKE